MGLTIVQGIIFLSYITFLLIKFGKPLPSISDSWYELKGLSYLFTLFCFSLGITMVFQSNETILFFLSGAGLCFTGVATAFKSITDTTMKKVHFLGAAVCIIFALIGVGVERGSFIPLGLFGISATIMEFIDINKTFTNKIWWTEIAAFICIILGLLFL